MTITIKIPAGNWRVMDITEPFPMTITNPYYSARG